MKKKWSILFLLIAVLALGLLLGDKYARYHLYREEIAYLELQRDTATLLLEEGSAKETLMKDTAQKEDSGNFMQQEGTVSSESGATLAEENPQLVKDTEREEKGEREKINLNLADKNTLMQLEGIGEVKAEEIILYREKYGKFYTIEELMNVKGIGEKTFEKNKERLCVE